jgi:hypothetical protein
MTALSASQAQAHSFFTSYGDAVSAGILTPTRRRLRVTVADTGSRMERQAAYVPDPGQDPLSAEAHEYVDGVQPMQRKYAQNGTYNGSDALKRLRGPDGG